MRLMARAQHSQQMHRAHLPHVPTKWQSRRAGPQARPCSPLPRLYPFSPIRATIYSIINKARLTIAGSPSSMDEAAKPHPLVPIFCNVAATRPVSPIGEAGRFVASALGRPTNFPHWEQRGYHGGQRDGRMIHPAGSARHRPRAV